MKRNLIIGGIALALLLTSIKYFPYHCNCHAPVVVLPASTRTSEVYLGTPQVKIGAAMVTVDVADTPALREQGLSGRGSLAEGTGMLFVFETPAKYGFWMKDMNFPIDIVWISADKLVVGAEKSAEPASYPHIFHPPSPVLYVMELPAGFVDAHDIRVGDAFSVE